MSDLISSIGCTGIRCSVLSKRKRVLANANEEMSVYPFGIGSYRSALFVVYRLQRIIRH